MSARSHIFTLWHAVHSFVAQAETLLSFCDDPDPEPLGDGWLDAVRGNLVAESATLLDMIDRAEMRTVFDAFGTDAATVRRAINAATRDGRSLATLLHNRPELSTVAFDVWPAARQDVYTGVHSATRELVQLRGRLAEAATATGFEASPKLRETIPTPTIEQIGEIAGKLAEALTRVEGQADEAATGPAESVTPQTKHQQPTSADDTGLPIIWSHGGRSYSRDRVSQYFVTREEDFILTAFQQRGTAMDTTTLLDVSGVTNIPRVMANLIKKYDGTFADAVRKPGKKNAGGYLIRVQDAT
ncbi:MAG: hypothetical protein C0467_15900 [Planctomycetaceae bacterium]|nr:hypothetical protein [Planctomycetaceae bacterium]